MKILNRSIQSFFLIGVFILTISQAFCTDSSAKTKHPDIVFIAVDDMPPLKQGCYGDTLAKTPNIDALAKDSLRFDAAYCSVPLCNPTRTCLITGLRPETTKVYNNETDWREVLKGVYTLPEHFTKNGYETVLIGKLYHEKYVDGDKWSQYVNNKVVVGVDRPKGGNKDGELKQEAQTAVGGAENFWGPSVHIDKDFYDWNVADQAEKIINQKQDKPLFLVAGTHRPHFPLMAPKKYFDLFNIKDMPAPTPDMVKWKNGDPEAAEHDTDFGEVLEKGKYQEMLLAYYATQAYVDNVVGIITDALKKAGRYDDAVIIFWSDHGVGLGDHGCMQKGHLYENIVKIPLLIHAPGITKPGSECNRLVESVDLFATICDLAGIPIPEKIQSISMMPILKDPTHPWKLGAITYGTSGKSKKDGSKADPNVPRTIRTEKWRYTEYPDGKEQLYSIEKDLLGYNNVANDPANKSVIQELKKLLNSPDKLLPAE
jgi:arylsulfatase A-like enzyme